MSDNDKTIELNRRRVLGGIATIGAASAALGAGTFAVFSESETSEDNNVNAGELTLDVTNGSGSDAFGYTFDNIVPGNQATVTADISITADFAVGDITVTTSTDKVDGGQGDVNLANALAIDSATWDGDDIAGPLPDTVEGLASNNVTLTSGPAESGGTTLSLTVTFDENQVGNIDDYQGASVDIDHTFTVEQDTS